MKGFMQVVMKVRREVALCAGPPNSAFPAIINNRVTWLGTRKMNKMTLVAAIIRVIFPRSLALLSADAAGELVVLTIMWM